MHSGFKYRAIPRYKFTENAFPHIFEYLHIGALKQHPQVFNFFAFHKYKAKILFVLFYTPNIHLSGASQKNLLANARNVRDIGLIPRSGRSPGGGNGNPTLVFLPGESHRGPWRATIHRVSKSRIRLKELSTQVPFSSFHPNEDRRLNLPCSVFSIFPSPCMFYYFTQPYAAPQTHTHIPISCAVEGDGWRACSLDLTQPPSRGGNSCRALGSILPVLEMALPLAPASHSGRSVQRWGLA